MAILSDEQKTSILAKAKKNYESYLRDSAHIAKSCRFRSIFESNSVDEDLEKSTHLIIQEISHLILESEDNMSDISDITNSLEEDSLGEDSFKDDITEVVTESFERAFTKTPPPSPIMLAHNSKYLEDQIKIYLEHLEESLNDADEQLCIGWREVNDGIDSLPNDEENNDNEPVQFAYSL
ncbi:MAG: hypothetical protein K0U37_08090 [Gammaproteobacteria bacterium]|nr:hypothetical protein [Gammaproteobacteria bacterium]